MFLINYTFKITKVYNKKLHYNIIEIDLIFFHDYPTSRAKPTERNLLVRELFGTLCSCLPFDIKKKGKMLREFVVNSEIIYTLFVIDDRYFTF